MHGEVGRVGFDVFEGLEVSEGVLDVVVEADNLRMVVGASVELSHFP